MGEPTSSMRLAAQAPSCCPACLTAQSNGFRVYTTILVQYSWVWLTRAGGVMLSYFIVWALPLFVTPQSACVHNATYFLSDLLQLLLALEAGVCHTGPAQVSLSFSVMYFHEVEPGECAAGLDARAAAIVMRTVKNTVRTGRTVVCTIHQPSLEIFQAFDELLLLQRGGATLYFGEMGKESQTLIDYFQGLGADPIEKGYNPATWVLEQTTTSKEEQTGTNFAEAFQKSEAAK